MKGGMLVQTERLVDTWVPDAMYLGTYLPTEEKFYSSVSSINLTSTPTFSLVRPLISLLSSLVFSPAADGLSFNRTGDSRAGR